MLTEQSIMIIKEAYKKGYRVSIDGEVLSPKNRKIKCRTRNDYMIFNIRLLGKVRAVSVHRLIAYQKYGDKVFDCDCVRHLDGNSLNNSHNNIEIGTYHDNMMDVPYEIRRKRSIASSHSYMMKWDEQDVKNIKKFYNETRSYKKTMEKFGILSKGTLHFILNKR